MEIKSLGKVKALGVTKDEEQECCVLTTVYQGYSALLYPVTSIPGSSVVKNLPASVEDPGSIPGSGRFPLEEGMATHCSILAWRIPGTEEPGGGYMVHRVGHRESDRTEHRQKK